jgi:hypothetical protein
MERTLAYETSNIIKLTKIHRVLTFNNTVINGSFYDTFSTTDHIALKGRIFRKDLQHSRQHLPASTKGNHKSLSEWPIYHQIQIKHLLNIGQLYNIHGNTTSFLLILTFLSPD